MFPRYKSCFVLVFWYLVIAVQLPSLCNKQSAGLQWDMGPNLSLYKCEPSIVVTEDVLLTGDG